MREILNKNSSQSITFGIRSVAQIALEMLVSDDDSLHLWSSDTFSLRSWRAASISVAQRVNDSVDMD